MRALVADVGPRAAKRFANFFGSIANDNTRAAYQRACQNFFGWCDANGLNELAAIEPIHVGAWVKSMAGKFEKPTIKQRLAAIRMLFDYLVVGQILAHAVRGPKHSVKRGKTPVLSRAPTTTLARRTSAPWARGPTSATSAGTTIGRPNACAGSTIVRLLAAAQARLLLDSIDVSTVVVLRDRALIALMTFSFSGRKGLHSSAPPIGTAAR